MAVSGREMVVEDAVVVYLWDDKEGILWGMDVHGQRMECGS